MITRNLKRKAYEASELYLLANAKYHHSNNIDIIKTRRRLFENDKETADEICREEHEKINMTYLTALEQVQPLIDNAIAGIKENKLFSKSDIPLVPAVADIILDYFGEHTAIFTEELQMLEFARQNCEEEIENMNEDIYG